MIGEIFPQCLLGIKIHYLTFEISSKLKKFSLCRKQCTMKPKSLLTIQQSLQSNLVCGRKMIIYQTVVKISQRLFLLMKLCTWLMITLWPMYVLIVVLLFTLKLLQKSDGSTENRCKIPDLSKNPSALSATINITVLIMSSISLKYFPTFKNNGEWFQQLLCQTTTLMIEALCPITTLNQLLTNLEDSYPMFYALWTMESKRKGLRVSSAFFQSNSTVEWTKQLLRFKSWVISGSREQRMEFRRLWWFVVLIKYSFLFQLFDFYCLLVQYLLFIFKTLLFCSFLRWFWVRSKSSSTTSMYGNTPMSSRSHNLS